MMRMSYNPVSNVVGTGQDFSDDEHEKMVVREGQSIFWVRDFLTSTSLHHNNLHLCYI